MEPARVKRVALGVAATVTAAVAVAYWAARPAATAPLALTPRSRVVAPAATRIKVEVVNATATRGLARQATFALRDAGFDVVRFATDTTRRDTTLILDRSGHPVWARLVARALGTGRVESRADSSRYLDITVLLGADWRAPVQPFYP